MCEFWAFFTSLPQNNEATDAVTHFTVTFKSPTNALVDPRIPIRTPIDFKFIVHE